MMAEDTYTIKIEQFEGPFDLLLFFIERDEIDILDIPIFQITDDFLQYIKTLKKLNLDVASEFILVAATLMKIKARSLIPRPVLDEAGQEIDLRLNLAMKLLDYKRFKDVVLDLTQLEIYRDRHYSRGNINSEINKISNKVFANAELESLSLFKILSTFQGILKNIDIKNRSIQHRVFSYPFTISDQKEFIKLKLKELVKVEFADIFECLTDRFHAIVTFLSLLEMINDQQLKLVNGSGPNQFFIQPL